MLRKKRYKINSFFVDVRRMSPAKEGRVVMLVHGIGVSGNYFMPFAKLLSQDYDVHVLDMPGYGSTPKPSHPWRPLSRRMFWRGTCKRLASSVP